jgi:hypothetical protein
MTGQQRYRVLANGSLLELQRNANQPQFVNLAIAAIAHFQSLSLSSYSALGVAGV